MHEYRIQLANKDKAETVMPIRYVCAEGWVTFVGEDGDATKTFSVNAIESIETVRR